MGQYNDEEADDWEPDTDLSPDHDPDGSPYSGITNGLPKRPQAPVAGRAAGYTRSRLPVRLAYTDPQESKSAALKREAAIKQSFRPQKNRPVACQPTRRRRPAV